MLGNEIDRSTKKESGSKQKPRRLEEFFFFKDLYIILINLTQYTRSYRSAKNDLCRKSLLPEDEKECEPIQTLPTGSSGEGPLGWPQSRVCM